VRNSTDILVGDISIYLIDKLVEAVVRHSTVGLFTTAAGSATTLSDLKLQSLHQ